MPNAVISKKQVRSIQYQMTIAKLPLGEEMAEFDCEGLWAHPTGHRVQDVGIMLSYLTRTDPEANPRDDHAQYVANWLRMLKSDKKAIFTAAAQAQAAVDFIL